MILRPYGWVAPAVEAPPNDAEHTQIGQEMADAIEESMGEEYTSQPSTSLYATCGSAGDFLYSEFGAAPPPPPPPGSANGLTSPQTQGPSRSPSRWS